VTGTWKTLLVKVVRVVREVYLKIWKLRGEGLINIIFYQIGEGDSLFETALTCFHSSRRRSFPLAELINRISLVILPLISLS